MITPTEQKNKVMYITGGGAEPECLAKIVELTGLTPVNGFKTNCPEEELALVIIDCGGTLRCGIYPKKGIPHHQRHARGQVRPHGPVHHRADLCLRRHQRAGFFC